MRRVLLTIGSAEGVKIQARCENTGKYLGPEKNCLNVDPDQTATEHCTINIDFFVKKHTNTLALTPSW